MAAIEQSMLAVGVEIAIIAHQYTATSYRQPASLAMRFFMRMPGTLGCGARDQQAVADALGKGVFLASMDPLPVPDSNSRLTGRAPRGFKDGTVPSIPGRPASYEASHGRWTLEEAAPMNLRAAPLGARECGFISAPDDWLSGSRGLDSRSLPGFPTEITVETAVKALCAAVLRAPPPPRTTSRGGRRLR